MLSLDGDLLLNSEIILFSSSSIPLLASYVVTDDGLDNSVAGKFQR